MTLLCSLFLSYVYLWLVSAGLRQQLGLFTPGSACAVFESGSYATSYENREVWIASKYFIKTFLSAL